MARELYQCPTRISLVYQVYVQFWNQLVGLYQVHQVCTRLYFANLANSLCERLPSHQYCTRGLAGLYQVHITIPGSHEPSSYYSYVTPYQVCTSFLPLARGVIADPP